MKTRMKEGKMSRVKSTGGRGRGSEYEREKQEVTVSRNGKGPNEGHTKLRRANPCEIYRRERGKRLNALYGLMAMIQKYRRERIRAYH